MSWSDSTRAMCELIDAAPSPYHAVAEVVRRLDAAGYGSVGATDAFPSGPGRWYLVDGGSVIAWSVPEGAGATSPYTVIGAHTDSPNLRVRARPDVGAAGWTQVGVEVYGGALVNSWLDRDLGLSGRVVIDDGDGPEVRLLLVDRPLLRVPQLAIHLDREIGERGLQLDRQRHLQPVWGLGSATSGDFVDFIGDELGVDPRAVRSWDLMTHDLTPSALLGRHDELVAAPRLDNLCSCWCALEALLRADRTGERSSTAVVALFDHEEVGSTTATGASGPALARVLERLVSAAGGDRDDLHRAMAASWVVSADMAHATHPNYVERHEPSHHIAINGGPVIKSNANQRYATDAITAARFVAACERAGVAHQRYVHRNDLPCGSTIGPVTAAELGVGVVDVGLAQLSMHSARELAGSHDPESMVAALVEVLGS